MRGEYETFDSKCSGIPSIAIGVVGTVGVILAARTMARSNLPDVETISGPVVATAPKEDPVTPVTLARDHPLEWEKHWTGHLSELLHKGEIKLVSIDKRPIEAARIEAKTMFDARVNSYREEHVLDRISN